MAPCRDTEKECSTVWILGDQLLLKHPALAYALTRSDREHIRVLLIESSRRITKLPYHKQKLVLLLSAMRHYAQRLRAEGWLVDYVTAENFEAGLRSHLETYSSRALITMAASEYTTRLWQQQLESSMQVPVHVLPNTQFLVERYPPYPTADSARRYIMENFYRQMRRNLGILLHDNGAPIGGRWNFDHDNRKRLPRSSVPPTPLSFTPDVTTRSVIDMVASWENTTGSADGFAYAVTHSDARRALEDFIAHRLPLFGDYEDAMSTEHALIYHSMLSAYLNIGLLEPLEVVRSVEAAYHDGHAPINAVEGFVRQVIGWREYIYWRYWQQMPDLRSSNAWNAHRPVPSFLWTGQTDMRCIRILVNRLLKTGYSHHIERLMIICNFCLLAGIRPDEVADWFLSMYVDAYEWVVDPNVIGMGLNADGGQIATKPYIASANYISRMSDFCTGCRFNPRLRTGDDACPFNYLYWNFLIQNERRLLANPRIGKSILGLRHLDAEERRLVEDQSRAFLDALD